MSRLLSSLAPAVARLLVAAPFLWSGWTKIAFPPGAAARIAARGLPFPHAGAIAAGLAEIALGLLLAAGLKPRLASGALVLYLVAVTWLFHAGAALGGDGAQLAQVLKNGAAAGALLLVAANGPGPLSLDRG